MPSVYRVITAAPTEARDDLERLWQDNLTLEAHPADKFAWLYLEAPDAPDAVLVLTADGAPVGTAGVGIRRFQLGDELGRSGLLADLAVDRAHRSVGPALALVRAGKALVDEHYQLAYGFPNKLAEGVFKRAGYQALGTVGRYAQPLRRAAFVDRLDQAALTEVPTALRPWAQRAAQVPALAAAAGLAADVVSLAPRALAAATTVSRTRFEARPRPDAGLDELWARARSEYQVIAERTHRFLAWRMGPRPERTWHLARDRATGALRAYAVVDVVGGVAHIRDLFGHRAEVTALLDYLPLVAYQAGATSLSMRYLGAPWLVEALTARGFAPRTSTRMIAVSVGATTSAAARARILDPSAWHLTDVDEDV